MCVDCLLQVGEGGDLYTAAVSGGGGGEGRDNWVLGYHGSSLFIYIENGNIMERGERKHGGSCDQTEYWR